MKKFSIAILAISLLMVACGEELTTIEQKKAELAEIKTQARELRSQIKTLEDDIAEMDSSFIKSDEGNITLVSVMEVPRKDFIHKTEIRGAVKSRRNVVVSAETTGRILSVKVKEGDLVKKGQLLITLDAQTLRDNIDEIDKQMELAKALYERQANLWKDSIGSEIQFLQAKNNYESLQKRKKTMQTQMSYAYLKAPFNGSVEEVMVKEGEMAAMGIPVFRLVSLENMYIQADASESFVGRFRKNQEVDIEFPSIGLETDSRITAIGQVIDEGNRTFSLEVAIPKAENLKPNMTVVIDLTDYSAEDAFVLPAKIIQRDANGHFVFVKADGPEGPVAEKKTITLGKAFEGEAEITDGLSGTEQVIYQGYRDLTNGVTIRITDKVADSKLVSDNGK